MIEPYLSDDAWLADIDAAPRSRDLLSLWWLGQSGFLVQWGQTRLLLDPYLSDSLTTKYANTDKPHVRRSRRVIDPSRLRQINFITASHGHTDHLDPQTLQAIRKADSMEPKPWQPIFVAPRAIEPLARERWGGEVDVLLSDSETKAWTDVQIRAVTAAHEEVERNVHGYSIYLGYVLRLGPFTVYHSGDTVLHDRLIEQLTPFDVDLALLPINGRSPERRVAGNLSGREAAWLAKQIGAKLVIPCHYDMFEFNTATPDEFVTECEKLQQPFRVLRLGERLSIQKQLD